MQNPFIMFKSAASVNVEESEKRSIEESITTKPTQNFVTCIHRAKIAGFFRNVTITWSKSLIGHSLFIMVENPSEETHSSCKIDLKTWQFWGRKGMKSFRVDEKRVDIYWDLRSAKFSSSPEPTSDYYVAFVSEEEVVLLLGDQKKEAFKRTRKAPSLSEPALVHKKENVFAKKCFYTRTMLGQGQKEHDIIIESVLSDPCEPEMWISVDGTTTIRIVNLHWRFRGNETIEVDNVPVQILWDVHDWLYNDQTSGAGGLGTFIFKQGTFEVEPDSDFDERISSSEDSGDGSGEFPSPMELDSTADFCHFLYAWRTE
ncbi:hypothetical protein M9H77_15012 [Catharanthus roseus]|uniref:Uncharacterized protein n=1 Tax=Catharanthus roseus TaxID=4058 RepID=A0ACC0BPS4_CATRO|nr:hypothetical protein M9H77_15012 [Catharanthus roseus]